MRNGKIWIQLQGAAQRRPWIAARRSAHEAGPSARTAAGGTVFMKANYIKVK